MYKNFNIKTIKQRSSKTFLIMKLAIYLILFGLLPIQANLFSQKANISLEVNNLPIRDALRMIEKESGMRFFMSDDLEVMNKRITLHVQNQNFVQVMNNVLDNNGLSFRFYDDNIVLITAKDLFKQGITITGTVTDSDGEPIPGVNVLIRGSTIGVTTGIDGRYSVTVPDRNSVLTFSFIGYATQEVVVGTNTIINMTMSEDTQQIDEVIVVGYGVQRRSSITGSAAALSNADLQTVTSPRTENMLSGKVPGVFVASGTGRPGDDATILVRGQTTISSGSNNRPLWVIDGVIVGSGSGELNPADIESITVLKDAASTAIYGSQGSNGVIVVTTRRGRIGEPAVTFSAKASFNKLHTGNMKPMNATQLYDYWNSFSNPESFNTTPWWSEDLKNRNFNWMDDMTQIGKTQDYALSISGGTDRLSAYASLGYYDETGAITQYDYKRYTARANFNWKVRDWLTVKPSLSLSMRDIFSQQQNPVCMFRFTPWDSPYNRDGTLFQNGRDADPIWVFTAGQNPKYDLQWNYDESVHYEFMGNFDFTVRLNSWLTFESVNNYRFTSRHSKYYVDPRSIGGSSTGGYVRDDYNGGNRIYTNQLLRFDRTFNRVHQLTGILAYEWNQSMSDDIEARGYSIPPGAEINDLSSVPGVVNGSKSESAVQSYFFNANYAYNNRYLFQASVRRDGSSNFGRKNQYCNFFSLSAAWNMHDEAFFEGLKPVITTLKPRISFGSSGNRPDGSYPQYTIYSVSMANSYNGTPGALLSTSAGNDRMTWETTYTTNFGIDATFFNNRLNLTFDMYARNTSGLLYEAPLPSVWGVTSIWRNVGEVRNRGFEITLGGTIIRTTDMRWTAEANLGLNRNKIHKLYNNMEEQILNPEKTGGTCLILKPGYDSMTYYMPEWAGVNPDNGAPQWYTTGADGQRVITNSHGEASANMVMTGTYLPDFFGGFNTMFRYKDFDLTAIAVYSVGGKIYNYTRTEYDSDGAYTDRNQIVLQKGWNRWEKPGDKATHPKPAYGNRSDSEKVSSRFLEDGTYFKLKAVTAGYNLPVSLKYVSNIRIYVSGENLLTITKFSGLDPEQPPRNNSISGTFSEGQYPQVRRFIAGLNVRF